MSRHFTSVLKLTDTSYSIEDTRKKACDDEKKIVVREDRKSVALPLPLARLQEEKRSFPFDHVYTPREDSNAVYKQSVREIVESALVGYHATVLSFGVGERNCTRALRDEVICKAAGHIFRCLKKSRRSHSAASLVVLCSFVMITGDTVYDLLHGFIARSSTDISGSVDPAAEASSLTRTLTLLRGNIVGASVQEAKATSKVEALLKYGSQTQHQILHKYKSAPLHHTMFQLAVEYAQFGTMNAPVSGNLSFVDIGEVSLLAHQQEHMTEEKVDQGIMSLFNFVDVITALTTGSDELQDRSSLPSVPITQVSELYSKSTLTHILKEALGGNCKTLLICYAPDIVTSSGYDELYEALKLASRARLIQNTPNKRDLAEKALMSAYMKQLEQQYGKGWTTKEGNAETKHGLEVTHTDDISEISEELDATNKTVTDTSHTTTGEQRRQNVEMAASALAAAAMGGEEEGESSDEEEEEELKREVDRKKTSVKLRKKRHSSKLPTVHQSKESSSTAEDVTVDALVAILQDPDKGVPRAATNALKDIKIKKDAGALFSGADIVRWMVENIAGVENEEEAETLGQLLLDRGAIFHSEGSMVFANAETLFYYARHARPTSRLLSPEEIHALLAQTKESSPTNVTEVQIKQESQPESSVAADFTPVSEINEGKMNGIDTEANDTQREIGSGEIQVTDTHPETSAAEGKEGDWFETPEPSQANWALDAERQNEDSFANIPYSTEDLDDTASSHTQQKSTLQEQVEEESGEEGEPNTAQLQRIPSVHTLENTEDYPHPLHMAVAIGKQPGVIRHLIMMFGVDKCDEYGRTPLMFAARGNKKASCGVLMECGAEVNKCDSSGLTALHVACYHGNKEAVGVLLRKAYVEISDKMGHSALHWSTVPVSPSCLQLLISHVRPELVSQVDRSGLTALHWAIYYDHPQHLKLLIRKHENPLEIDPLGCTLMTYTIGRQALKCMKVLMETCPHLLMHPDRDGGTPLHHASAASSPESLQLLLSYRPPKEATSYKPVDINCTDQYLRTPLHCAVLYNRLHNALILVGNQAQYNLIDKEDRTPLDYAKAMESDSKMVALLEGKDIAKELMQTFSDEKSEVFETPPHNSKICSIL